MTDADIKLICKIYALVTCSVMQAIASITKATTSERRMARNARFTDRASVVLPDEATAAFFLIPAVSVRCHFCRNMNSVSWLFSC